MGFIKSFLIIYSNDIVGVAYQRKAPQKILVSHQTDPPDPVKAVVIKHSRSWADQNLVPEKTVDIKRYRADPEKTEVVNTEIPAETVIVKRYRSWADPYLDPGKKVRNRKWRWNEDHTVNKPKKVCLNNITTTTGNFVHLSKVFSFHNFFESFVRCIYTF